MNNHVSEEERLIRINRVATLIEQGISIRECAKYLSENEFKISSATVKDYIDRLEQINKVKYNNIMNILNEHKPLTISNDEVRKRIKNVVLALKAGYTIEEIAQSLNSTPFIIYRDFRKRLSYLTEEELKELDITNEDIEEINKSMTERSLNNLKRR